MRVSLKTLAAEAGVSVATASRALRDLACVDAATRLRVREVAARLGYVRDPLLASAFTFARRADKPVYRETLAFLAPEPPSENDPRPWMTGIWSGLVRRAGELGYRVESFRLPEPLRAQRHLGRQLQARGVRGAIFGPRALTDAHRLDETWARFSTVEIGHTLDMPSSTRIDRLISDDMECMLAELYRRGYRRIGLAMQQRDEQRRHWAVFAACLLFERRTRMGGLDGQSAGARMRVASLFEDRGDYSPAGLEAWIRKRQPDVIIANGPEPLDWLQNRGWRIPSDLGLCRIDCVPSRPESGLGIRYETLGIAAVDQLSSTLERGAPPMKDTLRQPGPVLCISSVWHEGSTLLPTR